jgi:hypothetical protein
MLVELPSAQTLFLERTYAKYNDQLTFDLNEFLGDRMARLAISGPGSQARPAGLEYRPGLARQLRETIDGLLWVEVIDGADPMDADPPSERSRVPSSLLRTTILDGADFVAVRSVLGSIVGSSFARPDRSLWCRLHAESTFGSVVSAILSIAAAVDQRESRCDPRRDVAAWHLGATGGVLEGEVTSFMHRAQEALGIVLLAGDPASEPLVGCGSSDVEPERCLDVARKRFRGLSGWQLAPSDASGQRLDSAGFYLRTILTGESSLWCFGTQMDSALGETLWLFLDRRNSQGLGWAYLSALTRAIANLGREARQ